MNDLDIRSVHTIIQKSATRPLDPLWLHRLFDNADFGLLVIDPFGDRTLAATPRSAHLLGTTIDRLYLEKPSEVFRSVLPELHVMTQACLDGPGRWQSEFTVNTPRRGAVQLDCHASLATLQEGSQIVLVMSDARRLRRRIAKAEFEGLYRGDPASMRQADETLRDLERGNRLILNAVGEGIYGVNRLGETTFVNPAAERMLGWSSEEIVGKVAHDLMHHSHACGDEYPIQNCPIYAAFRDGEVHEVRNEVFWRKDGTSFPVEYTSTPIEDDGKLVGAVVVFRDVSKRQEQENQLRRALAEVERLRERLEMENAYLLDELDERHNRARDRRGQPRDRAHHPADRPRGADRSNRPHHR